jgi:cell wall-associated NlpC family hydrolase
MLDKLSKKQKQGLTVTIVLTGILVSGSAPMYSTDPAAASPSIYEPILKPNNILKSIPPSITETAFLAQITNFGKLSNKINDLELKIKTREQTITAIQKQAESKLAAQREVYVSMDEALQKLLKYVGKSPYGFGNDPRRWDCSGLTLWFYQEFRGIELPHSATAQMREGEVVDAPIPGDLVAFKYKKSNSAFHIGVYLGSGLFIHAKNYSADTVLETVEGFAKNGITVVYVRY